MPDTVDPAQLDPVDPAQLDPVLAVTLTGLALDAEVLRRLHARGFPDVRTTHGFVFQHLVGGPLPVGALARRMGVSQQAASKAVHELERLDYLERTADAADGRVRRVALSRRGTAVVQAGRDVRAELADDLAARLGARRVEAMRGTLLELLDAVGGTAAVRRRRVPLVR
jgi:DNA-binding MarR family transcriptional regulator